MAQSLLLPSKGFSSPLADIEPGAVVPALDNPEPTKDKRERQLRERSLVLARPREKVVTLPGLDPARLTAKYGQGLRPQLMCATFRAPLGATQRQYERIRNEAIRRWMEYQHSNGLDLYGSIDIAPGVYPAHDLATGKPLPGEREFMVQATFLPRKVEEARIELPPHLLEPVVLK